MGERRDTGTQWERTDHWAARHSVRPSASPHAIAADRLPSPLSYAVVSSVSSSSLPFRLPSPSDVHTVSDPRASQKKASGETEAAQRETNQQDHCSHCSHATNDRTTDRLTDRPTG